MLGYAVMLALGVALFFLVRHLGTGLTAAAPQSASKFSTSNEQSPPNVLEHVLLGLFAVILAARLAGALCKRIHQPPVIGEVLAGIMLGPSLLGRFVPGAMAALFPNYVIPALGIIAQVGVVLYMFLVGLDLNTARLRERSHTALAISHASIVCPFVLGSILSLYLYPRLSTSDVPFTAFALFLGVSMSVTAFPVLARILTDRGVHRSRMGAISLTCAAVDDVSAWCLLALVVGVVHSRLGGAVLTAALTLIYIAGMFFVIRPLASRFVRWCEHEEAPGQQLMAVALISLLLSCLATEFIGIHALFGAFILGAVVPHDSRAAHVLTDKLNDFVVVMLLPAFFALTGLRTQIGLIAGVQWLTCGLIVLVAFAGKFGGTAIAARLTGLSWRDSSALGILMNTRGLMELIVLNVGLDLGVISPTLFAMLVIMAVVTTFTTSPILDRLISKEWYQGAMKVKTA